MDDAENERKKKDKEEREKKTESESHVVSHRASNVLCTLYRTGFFNSFILPFNVQCSMSISCNFISAGVIAMNTEKETANFPLMMLTIEAWIQKTNDKPNIEYTMKNTVERTTNDKMLWSTKLIIITTDAGTYVWSLMRV